METNWYEYLKDQIQSEKWISKRLDYAFMHGQVMFAYAANLITVKQKDELCEMIPEY